jgi:hypothetical protein
MSWCFYYLGKVFYHGICWKCDGVKQTLKSISALPILTYCSFVSHPQFKLVYCGILEFKNSNLRIWKCKRIVELENTFHKCGFYCWALKCVWTKDPCVSVQGTEFAVEWVLLSGLLTIEQLYNLFYIQY